MSYDPAKTGESPVVSDATVPPPSEDAEPAASDGGDLRRALGFRAEELAAAAWLPDDPTAMSTALLGDGRPFNGAFVPLVIHDPILAERSYDAAEWAADLISGESGRILGIAPFAEKGWAEDRPLSPRQWNHMAAMIERLEDLCSRFKLRAVVSEVIGGRQVREDGGVDPEDPIHFVLDAGSFVPDGFVLAQLISPERVNAGNLGSGGGLRSFLKGQ